MTHMTQQYIRVLTIAGSDSGGGAGIQADLKTFAALGCYGMSAITALTAQNTQGVTAIHAAPADFLVAQIDAVMGDIGAHAVKVGMLHAPEIVRTVAAAIDRHGMAPVVLDPVMVSATGAPLIEPAAVQAIVRELFPRAAIITPNLDEAALLLGRPITAVADLESAAQALIGQGAQNENDFSVREIKRNDRFRLRARLDDACFQKVRGQRLARSRQRFRRRRSTGAVSLHGDFRAPPCHRPDGVVHGPAPARGHGRVHAAPHRAAGHVPRGDPRCDPADAAM